MAFFNTDARVIVVDKPLLVAAVGGKLEQLKKLAAELNSGGETLAETFLRVRDSQNRTALHLAATGGRNQICKYLIQSLKLDVDLVDGSGCTPLHQATLEGKHTTVEFLLNIGANPNVLSVGDFACTPLHVSVSKGLIKLVSLLIERGAEIEAIAPRIGSPLHCAIAFKKKDSLIALLRHKANPNALVEQWVTPLQLAITTRSFDCMEPLMKAGADPNFESPVVSALNCAATHGESEAVKLLLKYGANPNVTDWTGLTVLEQCVELGYHEVCKILFPVTNKIPYIKDWTLKGVLNHVSSGKAMLQREVKKKEYFAYAKSMGEASFKKKDYYEAFFWYSQALDADPRDAAVFSNRSLCQAKMNNGRAALSDAQTCISIKPYWFKGHYRAGAAYTLLKDYVRAGAAFSEVLKLDPHNKDIQAALREAVTAQLSSSMRDRH